VTTRLSIIYDINKLIRTAFDRKGRNLTGDFHIC
jgi:hypothetical protein